MTDDELIERAAGAAQLADVRPLVSPATISLLRAIASTRSEAERHELARRAEVCAGEIGAVALQVLRVAIFAIG